VFYPTPNLAAHKLVQADIANDVGIYPPPAVMQTLFLLQPLPSEILRLENRLWVKIKTGS
jgi:putrescine transport system substrate-binding protein